MILKPVWNYEEIKRRMIQQELTAQDLALRCEVGVDRIYQFLNKRRPSFTTGRRIAQGLGCGVEDLVEKKVAPEP